MKPEHVVIINVFSERGTKIAKEFHLHGRPVIGICTPQEYRLANPTPPLGHIAQLIVTDAPQETASVTCKINRCDFIIA